MRLGVSVLLPMKHFKAIVYLHLNRHLCDGLGLDYGAAIPTVITIDILSRSGAVLLLKGLYMVQYHANKGLAKAVPSPDRI